MNLIYLSEQHGEVRRLEELLSKAGFHVEFRVLASRAELLNALQEQPGPALVVVSETCGELGIKDALTLVREKCPSVTLLAAVHAADPGLAAELTEAGADEVVTLNSPWAIVAAFRRAFRFASVLAEQRRGARRERAMTRLLAAVQELSLARDLNTVQAIVRRAARDLTGAHGATFVLRDADRCFYADEDAIAPLWKGQRFPMSICISGWVMSHRQPVAIEDVFEDSRIPAEVYRRTFVKSMLMVPIRTEEPIGAIGNYWAERRRAEPEDIEFLQALANTTAVAMENVRVYSELEQRVKHRTALLEETNRELEAFSYSVSHDIRSPLTAVLAYAGLLRESLGDNAHRELLEPCDRIMQQAQRMNGLVRDLLRLAQVTRAELTFRDVDLTRLAQEKIQQLRETEPHRNVLVTIAEGLHARADPGLIAVVLENLLSNAWKYTGKVAAARIDVGVEPDGKGGRVFYVRDNGAGFDAARADRLFAPFQRMHAQSEFAGTGVGLATVQRIIHKHGGRIWARAAIGEGASFFFTLPGDEAAVVLSQLQAAQ